MALDDILIDIDICMLLELLSSMSVNLLDDSQLIFVIILGKLVIRSDPD